MSQMLQIRNKGLYTSPNEFSSVPEGGLLTANNVVISVDNIVEPRRGLDKIYTLPLSDDRISRYGVFQDVLVANWSNGKVGYLSSTAFVAVSGTYSHPNANTARLRFLPTNNNLYFTTSAGVYVQDAYNGTPVLSGVPRGLDIQVALTGASGFLATANQTAYRIVWGIRDAANNIKKGSPSGRAVLINGSGGNRDATLVTTIPAGITTAHFFQIYRSRASGGAAIEPDDELGLVYENNPTAGELVTGTISITDATDDDLRGETLYTSPSEEGIDQSNERAPQADYIEEFQGCVFYANCKSKHRKIFTILGCGGTSGIQLNDVLTIAGVTYTAKATESIGSREFDLVTAGTAAQNIYDTAESLVRVINRASANTLVYAYYISDPNELPGKILIEERGIGGSAFTIQLTTGTTGGAYNPNLTSAVSSTNDDLQNQIMFSKTGEGEAVPLYNNRRVGSANTAILGIKKLGNSLFIWKDREGIYRVTGTEPGNFEVDLFDSSAKLFAPDSIDVVNNQIWCLCDQGITVVTETGVSVISRPIEDLILDQYGSALTQVKYYSFGVGYETERQYVLWTVSSSSDTHATQAFVFNAFTQAYTRWPLSASAAILNPVDDRLYVAHGDSYYTQQERKDRTYSDYIDAGTSYTIVSSSGTSIVMADVADIEVGDLLYQSSSVHSAILAIDVLTKTLTLESTLTWSAGAATVYKAINCEVEYAAVTGGNPGVVKRFPEISMLFGSARFSTATLSFATDASTSYEDVSIAGPGTALWGLFAWGESPWGGTSNTIPIRTLVPLEKQRGALLRVRFTHRQGYGSFRLYGFSLPIIDTASYQVAK